MSADGLISQERLLSLSGLKNKAALRKHLKLARIPFREINGKIITTEEAITATLVGREKKKGKGPDLGAITRKRQG